MEFTQIGVIKWHMYMLTDEQFLFSYIVVTLQLVQMDVFSLKQILLHVRKIGRSMDGIKVYHNILTTYYMYDIRYIQISLECFIRF